MSAGSKADREFMQRALALARRGRGRTAPNPVVGAVVVRGGRVVGEGWHRSAGRPHAEAVALAGAGARARGATLYVTLEPCTMCVGAIFLARIARVVYGAADPKGGGVEHGPRIFDQPTCHHRPDLYPGVGEVEAGVLLRDFFRARR